MDLEDALQTTARLRFPVWDRKTGDSKKISDLEDYTCTTAFYQGELMEQRMGLRAELERLREEWAEIVGWEPFRRNKTEGAVDAAKREVNPELHRKIRRCERIGRELSDQIERMEREAGKASRVYTFIAGA